MLLLIAAYLFWVGRAPRIVGRDDWQVTLPGARLTLVQIGIGILDLGLSSLAMYMLLPAGADSDFIAILVTFIFATLLGFASHAPGGIGVFDAAMMVALPQFERRAAGVAPAVPAALLHHAVYARVGARRRSRIMGELQQERGA